MTRHTRIVGAGIRDHRGVSFNLPARKRTTPFGEIPDTIAVYGVSLSNAGAPEISLPCGEGAGSTPRRSRRKWLRQIGCAFADSGVSAADYLTTFRRS